MTDPVDRAKFVAVITAPPTNRSGTITLGGTAQALAAATVNPRRFSVQNQSLGDLYVSATGTATADEDSIKVPAGALYESPYSTAEALSIIGATTGQAFFAEEW
jgi:hypothetical protein